MTRHTPHPLSPPSRPVSNGGSVGLPMSSRDSNARPGLVAVIREPSPRALAVLYKGLKYSSLKQVALGISRTPNGTLAKRLDAMSG